MTLRIVFILLAWIQKGISSTLPDSASPSTSPGYAHSGTPSPQTTHADLKKLPLIPSLNLPSSTMENGFKTPTFDMERGQANPYKKLPNQQPLNILENKIQDNEQVAIDCQRLRYFENTSFDETSDLLVDFVRSQIPHLSLEEQSKALHARIYDYHFSDLNACVQTMQAMAKLEIPIDCTYFLFINEQLEAFINNKPAHNRHAFYFTHGVAQIILSMSVDQAQSLCCAILSDSISKFMFDCFLCDYDDPTQLPGTNFHDTFKNFVVHDQLFNSQTTLLNKLLLAHTLTRR
ncbi:MAG: hypothetical protein CNLJKLNK_00441 [Holosporales bacterium]